MEETPSDYAGDMGDSFLIDMQGQQCENDFTKQYDQISHFSGSAARPQGKTCSRDPFIVPIL
jgi:hypothetical protein